LEFSSSIVRGGLAIAAALALAWSFNELSPLLAAIAAICIYGGRWPGLLSIATLGVAFGVFMLFPGSSDPAEPKLYLRVVALLASALVICLLIHDHQSDKASQQAEEDACLIVENMPGLAWSADPEGNFRFVNQSVMDYVGRPPADLSRIEGSDDFGWRQVVHPDDADHSVEQWLHSLKTGNAYEIEHRIRRFDGSYRWFRAVGRSSRDSAGRITGWYGTTIDIDDRKQAEDALRKSEQQLRLVIDAIPALVWCTDPAGNYRYVNQRTTDYVGTPTENLNRIEGEDDFGWRQMVHPDQADDTVEGWLHSLKTGDPFEAELQLRRSDGTYRWFSAVCHPSRDHRGEPTGWYGTSIDIDDRKQTENALRKSEQQLRSTLDQLARASQAASLAEISASIAHEVNQPLAAIVANSHSCQQWLSAEPPNLQRAQVTLERVIRDANSAGDIVGRTRALFRQGALVKLPLSLNEVISEVLQIMHDEANARAICLNADLAINLRPISADRIQMQQVLVNLIRNGIDAMDTASAMPKSISIRSQLQGTQMVLVEVRDQGRGIEEPERIFEPFFTTKTTGMGIGLTICRSIIEAHEGRLWAARNDQGGTTFSFTLPIHVDNAA
jgi:hypothetical protein